MTSQERDLKMLVVARDLAVALKDAIMYTAATVREDQKQDVALFMSKGLEALAAWVDQGKDQSWPWRELK